MDPNALLAGLQTKKGALRATETAVKDPKLGAMAGKTLVAPARAAGSAPDNGKPAKVLLIIDYCINWYDMFRGLRLPDGTPIKVEQTRWKHMTITATADEALVHLNRDENPYPGTTQSEDRVVRPDFCLIRNFPTGLCTNNYKDILMGLMLANVPSVNSLHSIFMGMNRALEYAEMAKIGRSVGVGVCEPLPLVPLRYFSNLTEQKVDFPIAALSMPAVVKVGSAHAGYGKTVVKSKGDLDDVRSILMLNRDFYTVEGFVEHEFEFRIQKIGSEYRGFKRWSESGWRNNWGDLRFEDYPLTAQHRAWVDSVQTHVWGGLDILALDVLHRADGTEVILENNATACGLYYEHEWEDSIAIRDLVYGRMCDLWGGAGAAAAAAAAAGPAAE